jgi:hypothetical protein
MDLDGFIVEEHAHEGIASTFRSMLFDNEAIPRPPTVITNVSSFQLYSQTRASSAVTQNMYIAAKLAQGRMLTRRASRLRWY